MSLTAVIREILRRLLQRAELDILADSTLELATFVLIRHGRRHDEFAVRGVFIDLGEREPICCLGGLVPAA